MEEIKFKGSKKTEEEQREAYDKELEGGFMKNIIRKLKGGKLSENAQDKMKADADLTNDLFDRTNDTNFNRGNFQEDENILKKADKAYLNLVEHNHWESHDNDSLSGIIDGHKVEIVWEADTSLLRPTQKYEDENKFRRPGAMASYAPTIPQSEISWKTLVSATVDGKPISEKFAKKIFNEYYEIAQLQTTAKEEATATPETENKEEKSPTS